MSSEKLASIMKEAMAARKEGKIILVAQMNKNKKFQKEQLGKKATVSLRNSIRKT